MSKPSPNNCNNCDLNPNPELRKWGDDSQQSNFVIALAGNPNTGKSTVFNALTGLRQHTGNWPGKTVTRAEGAFGYRDKKYKLIDLPGTYSLLSTSEDEEIARNFILFGQPDITIVVVDATRLERNLNLVLQILEITPNTILCLNLIDEAERHGIEIDDRSLSRELGIPVVPTSARYGRGLPQLLQTIDDMVQKKIVTKPHRIKSIPQKIRKAVEALDKDLKREYPQLPNTRWIALRLLEGDRSVINAIKERTLGNLED